MKRFFRALAALFATVAAAPAANAAPGDQVEASMTYHGVRVKLDHVLIVRHGNEENAPDPAELRIFLSDRDIPRGVAAAANTLAAQSYVRRANFNGVVIVADAAGQKSSAVTYVLNAPGIPAGTSVSSTNSDAFSQYHVSAGRASGAATIDSDELKVTARFDAPVDPNPITSDLKGAAALASAPAKAMLACTHAVHVVDLDALTRLNSAARNEGLNDFRAQAGDQAFREALKGEPDADVVAKLVTRVIVRGANASVVLGEGTVAEMVLEDGAWKCN